MPKFHLRIVMSPSAARVGFLKTSQRDCFKPCLGECEFSSWTMDVRVWPRPVLGLDIFLLSKILLKTGSSPVWIIEISCMATEKK